jgi:hypothetical protein
MNPRDPFAPNHDPFTSEPFATQPAPWPEPKPSPKHQLPKPVPVSAEEICNLPDDFDPFAGPGIIWNGN